MATRILYAEDDEDSRTLVTDQLEALGYEVTVASDGREAIAKLNSREFDLLLLDIRMPHISGLDILHRLKDKKTRPRVIMVTGVDELSIAIEAVKLGASDYLTKPFRLEHLEAAIERVLQR